MKEACFSGPDPGDDTLWDPIVRDRIRRQVAALDVELPSFCFGYLNRGGPTAADPDVRADVRASLRRAIDAAAEINTEVILVPFIGDAEIETDRHRDCVVESIQRVADSAEAAGITLVLENTLSGEANLELLERIDSPAVGTYYDVGNAIAYDLDPVEDILTLCDDMVRLHINDRDADGACPIGEGAVNFEWCVDAIEMVGYDNWLVLETALPNHPLSDTATNLRKTQEYFEEPDS